MTDTAPVLALATELARKAGALQRERYETELAIETKSAAVDLVTEVDRACEALIAERLRSDRPDDAVIGEEGANHGPTDAAWRWVIDPLDGTTNYAHGYPRFCVSIGVTHEGVRTVGVVYDPLLDELFHAVRGEGAFCNGRPLRASAERSLDRALVATGFAYDRRDSSEDNAQRFVDVLRAVRAIRRDGSAALDLCYVAAGRLDAYWELKLHAWDVAAGLLIVDEAGGRTSDLAGGAPPDSGVEVVATNPHLQRDLLALIGRR